MYPACFRTGYIFLFPLYKMFSCVIIKVSNPHLKWGLLTLIYKFYDIRYNDDIEVELKFDKNSSFSVFCGSSRYSFSCRHEKHIYLTLVSYNENAIEHRVKEIF